METHLLLDPTAPLGRGDPSLECEDSGGSGERSPRESLRAAEQREPNVYLSDVSISMEVILPTRYCMRYLYYTTPSSEAPL